MKAFRGFHGATWRAGAARNGPVQYRPPLQKARAAEFRLVRSRRRLVLAGFYVVLVAGGLLLGRHLMDLAVFDAADEAHLRGMIVTAIAAYVLMAALPFVPAAEIGLSLMLILGPDIAVLVYASTVLALLFAYLAGRAVPASACAAAFEFFGLHRARGLVLRMAPLDAAGRLQLLLAAAPARVAPTLLRHRYLALAVALNLPGNTVMGGGGGIALSAGMSGLYPLPTYLATVAVAVAPVPLLIALAGLLP